jgi:methanogen homocitrate synthase
MREDVDIALDAGVSSMTIEVPSSDVMIEKGFQWTKEEAIDKAMDTLTYAKKHGLYVNFFPYDTTRADWRFLKRLVTAAVEQAHIDSVTVVDTFSVCIPEGIAYLVSKFRDEFKIPVWVHTHNDLGLAVANGIAGAAAGAECIHAAVNGMGDGCGNAATEEVAVALRVAYGVDLGLNYGKLYDMCKMVEDCSKVPLSPGKPVAGENCFRKESGIFVMFRDRLTEAGVPTAGCTYMPRLVRPGRGFDVVLGKMSGTYSIEAKLRPMGLTATKEQLERVLQKVKSLGALKKDILTDAEFQQILKAEGVL